MGKYEYGRIEKLFHSLQDSNIDSKTRNEIMKDGELIKETTTPKKKAEWMKDAIQCV